MDSSLAAGLSFIDELSVEVAASTERTWEVVQARSPRVGFLVAREESGSSRVLEGQHPFSRYRLSYNIDPLGAQRVRLRARTDAVFPGPHGALYRALVISTGAHKLVVRRMLRQLKRAAERA
jgi:hypothetical protein